MTDAGAQLPKAESGALMLGSCSSELQTNLSVRWPFAKVERLGPKIWRVDCNAAPKGTAPGFHDWQMLQQASSMGPMAVVGFFCDSEARAEGVRIYEEGNEVLRTRMDWDEPGPADSITWPIGRVSLMLGIPIEVITTVPRPPRPPVIVALESLHLERPVEDATVRREALDLLGEFVDEPAAAILVRFLKADDWVDRTHAARSYARARRDFGEGELPGLVDLLDDEDEGVREAVFEGLHELIGNVDFADEGIQLQIDLAIQRGLKDEDEDVQAAAAKAQELRKTLLG